MPRGENTILRESGKPEPTWTRILKRNASPMELLRAKVQQVGREFQADGRTYTIEEIKLDTANRLLAVGKLKRDKHE